VEEEKPYWMNLTGGTSFSGPLRFELENYFPEAHYKQAIDQAFKEKAEDEIRQIAEQSLELLRRTDE
jgi:hypothetical protein